MSERLGGTGGRREPGNGPTLGHGTGSFAGTGRGFGNGAAGLSPAKEKVLSSAAGGGGRPTSAPPARRDVDVGKQLQRTAGVIGGARQAVQRPLSASQRQSARGRVEESRLVKEAQYWGRVQPPKRDLPAYWSVSAHGQPFNDERLAQGAAHIFQILDPPKLNKQDAPPAGPATLQAASLRKSLELGKRLYSKSDLSPLTSTRAMELEALTVEDREYLLMKLPPQAKLHALRSCHDRDTSAQDFMPWTQAVQAELNAAAWARNKEQCIRLAVQKLEVMMRTHLEFLSEMECRRARAPAALTKDVLKRAFWKVDPYKTGSISLQQFLQVWQNVLQLWEYTEALITDTSGRTKMVFQPTKPFVLDRNAGAAIFVKYGFDRDGLLPYVVFIQALCASPARLLGQEIILDNTHRGKNGLCDEVDVAMCVGDAKILYPKCKKGVFPPSGFDPLIAFRSMMLPKAHLHLEHVYGYAGISNLSNNVFYTHNTSPQESEVVYYTGAVGIVFTKSRFDDNQPCQRFFFGHDNDIECLAIHPNRRFVATGQQLAPGGLPYLCIWDIDTCEQLQRLDHCQDDRSVIACCFSGMRDAQDPKRLGGSVVCTVTSDDRHTIHLWSWMTNEDAFCKTMYIPGWCYGPDKKLRDLQGAGLFFRQEQQHAEPWEAQDGGAAGQKREQRRARRAALAERYLASDHPLITSIRDTNVKPEHAEGFLTTLPPTKNDGTWELLAELPGYNGTPPVVYGIVWNPFRPHTGAEGSEFCTYGVKHLKTWIMAGFNDASQPIWTASSASFGPTNVQNVLSACYVPAKHQLATPGDSCLLTGFASGEVGLWVPPYPTRPGAVYALTRMFAAHDPGSLVTLNDGTQVYGGVRVVALRSDLQTVMTAGSDGYVVSWQLDTPTGTNTVGAPKKGVALRCLAQPGEQCGPNRYKLSMASAPLEKEKLPMLRALDTHPSKPTEFIAGTDGCDIWEVDKDPRVLIEGHEDDLYCATSHPADPHVFATACSSNRLRIWDSAKRDVVKSASMGFPCAAVAYSQEDYPQDYVTGWEPSKARGYHLAVSAKTGRIAILDADTLQPLVQLRDAKEGVTEMKYSPPGGPQTLAAASNDLKIYLYRVSRNYQLIGRCVGHSGSVLHLDWTLPVSSPLQLRGSMLLASSDTSREILFWNPSTAKKVNSNQRDAQRYTWTDTLGFPVMGIWQDDSDGTDINSVDRADIGSAYMDDTTRMVQLPTAAESADRVPGAGYLVTADDFAFVKLFNFPVVWDDAPFKCFRGHSSHVTCVRFSSDCRLVLSVGGHDRGVYQWRTTGINAEDADNDKAVLEAMRRAVQDKRDESLTQIPKPLAKWGDLDGTGKNFGPVGDAEKLKSGTYNLAGGLSQTLAKTSSLGKGAAAGGSAAAGRSVSTVGQPGRSTAVVRSPRQTAESPRY